VPEVQILFNLTVVTETLSSLTLEVMGRSRQAIAAVCGVPLVGGVEVGFFDATVAGASTRQQRRRLLESTSTSSSSSGGGVVMVVVLNIESRADAAAAEAAVRGPLVLQALATELQRLGSAGGAGGAGGAVGAVGAVSAGDFVLDRSKISSRITGAGTGAGAGAGAGAGSGAGTQAPTEAPTQPPSRSPTEAPTVYVKPTPSQVGGCSAA
jgi:hypothetical protein